MFTGFNLRNNNPTANLSIGVKNDGTIFTYAPTANSSANDQNIANTMWVNNKLNDYLPKTGGTIQGNLYIKNKFTDAYIYPTSTQENIIGFTTKNQYKIVTGIRTDMYFDGHVWIQLFVASSLRSNNIDTTLGCGIRPDGTSFTTAITPPSHMNNNQIATTKFVYNAGAKVLYYYRSGNNFYIKYSSGLLMQGGIVTISNDTRQITLLQTYSDLNYNVQLTTRTSGITVGCDYKNATKFGILKSTTSSFDLFWQTIGYSEV